MEFARVAGAARDIHSLRLETLPLLRRIFRSDSLIFWLISRDLRISAPLELNVPTRFFPMYRDYYCRLNPFDPNNLGPCRRTALSLEQLVPLRDFKKSEYYNDFIRPQNIRRQMVVYVRVDNALAAVICTHRFRDRRFGQEDLEAGDLVSSHLSTAFERVRMLERAGIRGGFFRMVLESAGMGFVVLDLNRSVIFLNRKAAEICSGLQEIPLSEAQRRRADRLLPQAVLNDCDLLRKRVEEALEPVPVRERTLRVSDSEQCRFRTRLADRALTDFDRPLLLVTMESLPRSSELHERAAMNGLDLTRREAEIVSYIFKGYRNAEIAERLFISEGTVKNHLRSIFEKAGVRNRTGLIHRVLSL
jgi:DNA-binding CsgD family transcriptional regulator/PAS domain-containing protein